MGMLRGRGLVRTFDELTRMEKEGSNFGVNQEVSVVGKLNKETEIRS